MAKRKRWHNLYARYRLREDEWIAIWMHQAGLCALCDASFDDKAPVIDHCHTTGRVRGMLCRRCNTALGSAERGDWLKRARKYLTTGGSEIRM